VNDITYYRRKG